MTRKTIDCHALDSAKTQNLIARNDDNVADCFDLLRESHNDKRDTSIFAKPQYDKQNPLFF